MYRSIGCSLLLVLSPVAAVAQAPGASPAEPLRLKPGQTWTSVADPGPLPAVNLNPATADWAFAGDVNGDGFEDYVLTAAMVQDERTTDPSDRVDKTLVYYGGNVSADPNQVVYRRLTPGGDVNGDGFDDALAFDGVDRYDLYLGTTAGFVPTDTRWIGIPHDVVVGFHDLDGDGFDDGVLFSNTGDDITVLWGAAEPAAIAAAFYDLPVTERMQAAVARVEPDSLPVLLVLDGSPYEDPIKLTIYRIQADRTLRSVQQLGFPSFEQATDHDDFIIVDFAAMILADVSGDGRKELFVDFASRYEEDQFLFVQSEANDLFEAEWRPVAYDGLRYAGDVDGDGFDDFFLRADPGDEVIRFGPLLDESGPSSQWTALLVPSGAEGGVPIRARVGDLTGDGRDDVLLRRVEPDATIFSLHYSDGSRTLLSTDVRFERRDFPEDRVPYTANVGDLDGDGLDDFAFVHQSPWPEANRVEVYFGRDPLPDTADLIFRHEDGLTPSSVAGGDYDGDGRQDLAVSYQYASGSVFRTVPFEQVGDVSVYLGASGFDPQPDHVIAVDDLAEGISEYNTMVLAVESVGDVTADGLDDLLVSLPLVGVVHVVPGNAGQPLTHTIRLTSGEGGVIAALGDLNGDETADFAVSGLAAPLFVHFGTADETSLAQPDHILDVPQEQGKEFNFIGVGVTAGDYDGDGWQDLATQVAFHADIANDNGAEAVFVYYGGPDFDATPDVRLPMPKRFFGLDEPGLLRRSLGELSFLPDLDGDGRAELLIGGFVARTSDEPTPDAVVWPGGGLPGDEPRFILEAPNRLAGLGADLNDIYAMHRRSAIGDFDGDGFLDLILPQENDNNDGVASSRIYRYEFDAEAVSTARSGPLPGGVTLAQNYPNPFTDRTAITFDLPNPMEVRLTVYDLLGRVVDRLVEGVRPAGRHVVVFDARGFESGVYLYRLDIDGRSRGRFMTVVR